MARLQTVLVIVVVAFLMMGNALVNAQCPSGYTSCVSGGCCAPSHPQCCIVNGVKLCCKVKLHRSILGTEVDTNESTSARYNLQ